jgi:His/Glu/Gln/Arg/opine family amino acid ABC transporter permease subunit
MSGVTITDERKKGSAFTRPYFLSGQVIVRRKSDTRFASADDLSKPDVVVAVQQETTGQVAAEKRGVPKDRLHRFDALPDACLDLRNGKSDAVIGDLPALAALVRKGFPELEIAPAGLLSKENLGIVARKDARDLVAAVNAALDKMMVDGRYAAIYDRWIGGDRADTRLIAGLAAVADQGTAIPPDIAAQVVSPSSAVIAAPEPTSSSGSALAVRPAILREVFPLLLRGARLTVVLTLSTLCLGVPLGLLIALARLSSFAPLRWVAGFYVEVVRGTPLLMQIFVIYFVLPALHINLSALLAGIAALTFNSAAYTAEIFRAGIESIDVGQREAARALGMSGAQTMRYVILPQTLRRVLPPLTNEAVALLKDSSLVSVVALAELMRVGKELATNTGAPTTVYLAVALIYLAMTLPLTFLVRYLEVRWQPVSRPRQRLKQATIS